MLGIPTVQDPYIQQMFLQVLTPILDPNFSEPSYGFHPGRSAQEAVRAAQKHAQAGKDWVVDIDITKFFDQAKVRKRWRGNHRSKQQGTARSVAVLGLRLVGLFPTGRGSRCYFTAGGLDSREHVPRRLGMRGRWLVRGF